MFAFRKRKYSAQPVVMCNAVLFAGIWSLRIICLCQNGCYLSLSAFLENEKISHFLQNV